MSDNGELGPGTNLPSPEAPAPESPEDYGAQAPPEPIARGGNGAERPPAGASEPLLMPVNYEVEQALLAGLLAENDAYDKVAGRLKPEHFADAAHGRIFEAIGKLIERRQTANAITLRNLFEHDEALSEVGGAEYLAKLQSSMIASGVVPDYGNMILDLCLRRRLISLGEDLVSEAGHADYREVTSDLVDRFAQRVVDLGENEQAGRIALLKQTEVTGDELRSFELVPQEWAVLYRIPRGEVTLFSGQGGLGKSMIAIQLQCAMAKGCDWLGYKVKQAPTVGVYCEEKMQQLARRFRVVRERMDVAWEHMNQFVFLHSLKGEMAFIVDVDRYNSLVAPTPLLLLLERQIERRNAELCVLDSLNRIFPGNENDRVQVTGFCRELEALANRTNCAILLLAHPSKSAMTDGTGYSGSTAWDSMVRSRCSLEIPKPENPELLTDEDIKNPPMRLRWAKGNYARTSDLDYIELERQWSFDSPEEPPVFKKIEGNEVDGQTLFLNVIDASHQAGTLPRPNATGRAKDLFAVRLVHESSENKSQRAFGKRPLTYIQCEELYRKLLNEGRLEVVDQLDDRRHKIRVVKTANTEQRSW